MADTNVPTVPTVPVHIESSTSAVPVTCWYRDIEWLVPNVPTVPTVLVHINSSTSNILVQRHRVAGTNVSTVPTVPSTCKEQYQCGTGNILAQRHRVAGTNVPTIPVHIKNMYAKRRN